MTAFIASLIFVVLAEMGDKTQLLAMAFACRFQWQTVLWAVFWATAANHLLAAAAGSWLVTVVPLLYIKSAAAASFILFGLWTLRGDTLHGEDKRYKFSPFWTVFVAFFMAEMGDKTQLATVSLAVEYHKVIPVWMGTTLGMVISNAIGIVFGTVMGRKIPEQAVKWFAALLFIGFGCFGLYDNIPRHFLTMPVIVVSVVILTVLIVITGRLGRGKRPLEAATSCPSDQSESLSTRKD